eukprot:Rhum_TRINITY_DN13154_c0_g1::Rhum_TRINITY_DN13154_c0_g1_i1::g.57482::m.57482/K08817/CCRK; cell cycle related kinase
MRRYNIGDSIGHGCYGTVHKAVFKATGKCVAIKVLQNVKSSPRVDSLSCQAFRELKALQRVQPHEHILGLYEAFPHGAHICLVTDLLHTDVHALLHALPGRYQLPADVVKSLLVGLLKGLAHIHDNGLIHRDLKPSNLLLTAEGVLKIGDFGLARSYERGAAISSDMTHEVGTKWYRSPELLLGSRSYTSGIDVWSTGCIMAELMQGAPLFAGTTEIDQIVKIFKFLGSPTDETWPARGAIPDWPKLQIKHHAPSSLAAAFPSSTPAFLALLSACLQYDSAARPTAHTALTFAYFKETPAPAHPSGIWLPAKGARKRGGDDWDDILAAPVPAASLAHLGALAWDPSAPVMQAIEPCAEEGDSDGSDDSCASSTSSDGGAAEAAEKKGAVPPADGRSPHGDRAAGCPVVVVPRPPSVDRSVPSCR